MAAVIGGGAILTESVYNLHGVGQLAARLDRPARHHPAPGDRDADRVLRRVPRRADRHPLRVPRSADPPDMSDGARGRSPARGRRPAGLVRHRGRHRPGRRRRLVHGRPRRGRGDRRRVGLRQVRHRDDADGADPRPQREVRRDARRSTATSWSPRPRTSSSKIRGAGIAMVFQDPMSSLNPVYRIGNQIVEQIRVHDHEISKAAGDGPRRRADGARRHPARGRAAALLPARVLGRHAPARDDRDGAVVLAEAADRRRADDRARRHDPGADPRRAAATAIRDGRGNHPRHPRPRRGRRHRRPGRRHVRRAASSSRARSTSSSTTRSTPTRGACWVRSRGSTATAGNACRRSPGLPPSLLKPPDGLPLPAALPARVRAAAPRSPSSTARLAGGARAPRPLLARGRAEAATARRSATRSGWRPRETVIS